MTKYTFSDLLQNRCFDLSKIEIPLLQRDYVQGQKSYDGEKMNKTGLRFIRAIFDSMQSNKTLDMDFIYGSVTEDGRFIPLDGQQRLTTLFLLHWYFACKDFSGSELDEKLKELSCFSYETRISSREFCTELCKLKKVFGKEERPSDYIRNEPWFFNKFNVDPTVSAMLNMLDAIHKLSVQTNVDYSKLNLLRFNVLNLENFGLTEELYLKMNARGKLLTEFEKLKAELEKKADDSKWEEAAQEQEKFYFKADREWQDLFWQEFKKSSDSAFLNFMANEALVHIALNSQNLESDEKRIQKIAGNTEELSADDFDSAMFSDLKKSLDLYCTNKNETKKPAIDLWDFCENEHTLFSMICGGAGENESWNGVTYSVRGIFYAQSLYLEKADYSESSFTDWMRVIRNIAQNATIDSVQTFRGFLNLIQELSAGAGDIYAYLSSHTVNSNFAKAQVQEEIYKAKLISKNHDAKKLISAFEENPFCKGRLYFAFYCCGVDLQTSEKFVDIHTLEKVKSVFDEYFSKDDISDEFRVLLFTCGNNRFYEYWGTQSYATETYKRCCIEDIGDLYWSFSRREVTPTYKDILKETVLKLSGGKTIEAVLSEYKVPDNMPKWEKWIISHPKEFSEHCSGHYFGITPDNKKCYLYEWRKRPYSRDDCFKVPTN